MSEKIEPALTAEEWILRRYERPGFAMELGADGPFPYRLDIEGNDSTDESPNSASVDLSEHGAATAAFALYNQPFGFTREDVELLRDEAERIDGDYESNQGAPGYTRSHRHEFDEAIAEFNNLADRIEALLPPDK